MQNVGKAPAMGEEGVWGSSSWMRGGKYLCRPGLCQAQCWAWRDKGPRRRWGLASEAGFQGAPQEARCRQWKPPTVGLVPRGRHSSRSLDAWGRVSIPWDPQSPLERKGVQLLIPTLSSLAHLDQVSDYPFPETLQDHLTEAAAPTSSPSFSMSSVLWPAHNFRTGGLP